MRNGPPARDGIPPLHSDGEALPKVACLSCVTSDDGDTPAELGDKLLAMHPPGSYIDSRASGTKACVMAICAYFAVFATSAFAAAEPARTADSARCDAANVSGDVTSHVRHRPCAQGIIVTPSGRLWSDRLRPVGSLVDGIWARCRARHIVSFNSLCLG